jgi:hypothetical protein
MKRLAAGFAAALALGAAIAWSQASPEDEEIRAMRDEMERSRKLSVANLEKPYFIQYLIDQAESFSVSASLGGLISRRRGKVREPEVRVRVGDYQFDNTGYTGSGFNFGTRYDFERFPLEDSYAVLRRYLWLETDSAYKSAVEALSRKRAALRNLNPSETIADFAHAEPVHHLVPFHRLVIDEEAWTQRVRQLSALFAEYPDVKNSAVELESSAGGFTLVNSEGTEVRQPEDVTYLRARAIAQASDGMTVRDAVTFHALDASGLPDGAELTRGVKTLAETVTALAHAPMGEDYNGPVLFEGIAGAQILAEVLGRNFSLPRRPVADGGRNGAFQPSELEGRIGARVLPDSFDVVDDPTQKEWRGRRLFGSYEVDREGVIPKPLHLIERGELRGYLLTRQPVRGYEGSNGRARLPGPFGANAASISNLFVRSSDATPVTDLRKKLMEICQARGKPYGIIVRKMDFPSSASVDEVRRLLAAAQGGRPVSTPILVYKLFPDGREELVRGLRFRGFNVRSFKDILAAGNDETAFDFLENGAIFALMGATGFMTEATVIAPSLLIDDLELHPVEDQQPKLPVVPAPEWTR